MKNLIKKILITGSSGTIGTALCEKLIEKKYEVIGIDKNEPQKEFSNFNFIKFDLTQYPHVIDEKLKEEKNIDLIIHLAANARVLNSILNPNIALENYLTNHFTFEFARVNKIPRMLYASSRETYGDVKELPVSEELAKHTQTKSPYTASKILGESLCYAYNECYNLDFKIARFSNVYGKYDISDRFVPKAIKALNKNQTFYIYGKKKLLDFTYIDDCVDGILILIENWQDSSRVFNVASGEQNTLEYAANLIKTLINSESKIETIPDKKGEVSYYQADISNIKRLGFSPKISLEKGLERSINYYLYDKK